jgi:hypothetical protein
MAVRTDGGNTGGSSIVSVMVNASGKLAVSTISCAGNAQSTRC